MAVFCFFLQKVLEVDVLQTVVSDVKKGYILKRLTLTLMEEAEGLRE